MGSISGTIVKLASAASSGHVALPVESFRLPYGCVVAFAGAPNCPTARLCPVPMTPDQSHAGGLTGPIAALPAPGEPPVLPEPPLLLGLATTGDFFPQLAQQASPMSETKSAFIRYPSSRCPSSPVALTLTAERVASQSQHALSCAIGDSANKCEH